MADAEARRSENLAAEIPVSGRRGHGARFANSARAYAASHLLRSSEVELTMLKIIKKCPFFFLSKSAASTFSWKCPWAAHWPLQFLESPLPRPNRDARGASSAP
eukprot:5442463-Pyramimonas_sp.AAC.1